MDRKLPGFTLIELIIVATISAILIVSTYGAITYYYGVAEVDAEARTLTSYLQLARQRSVSNDNNLDYSVKLLSNSYVGFYGDVYNAADPDNDVHEIGGNLTISTNIQNDLITFNTFTGRVDEVGTITITGLQNRTRLITINELGIIE